MQNFYGQYLMYIVIDIIWLVERIMLFIIVAVEVDPDFNLKRNSFICSEGIINQSQNFERRSGRTCNVRNEHVKNAFLLSNYSDNFTIIDKVKTMRPSTRRK